MISFDTLLARAALTFGYAEEELLAKRGRSERITQARQALMWAARYHGYSLVEIGRYMGGRDHTTVIYGSERAAERAETDAAYARILRELAGLPEVEEAPAAAPITTLPRGSRWWLHQAYGSRARLALAA
jgi:chromosomal replication initiation ATPase DnaA